MAERCGDEARPSSVGPSGAPAIDLSGAKAALATMHGKERVLAPLLARELGLVVEVARGIDTDRFGTFTREVPRPWSPLETARRKALAALEVDPTARIAIASEGSFGPHPEVPFAALAVELVLLVDPVTGLELLGRDATTNTNFAAREVGTPSEAIAFAEAVSFPSHALIVTAARGGAPRPDLFVEKGIVEGAVLERAVEDTLCRFGRAFVETDMRAHLNPTRMAAIERAGRDLVASAKRVCPACGRPGWGPSGVVPGRPCEDCGAPTRLPVAQRFRCRGCEHAEQLPIEGAPREAPAISCDWCNP
jgi:hypothetical protein